MAEVLNLETLPPEVLAELRDAAEKNGTTVEAEAAARIVTIVKRDKLPPLGEPIPSLEIFAPYDFPDPPRRRLKVKKHDGPPPLEFWYGEDKLAE